MDDMLNQLAAYFGIDGVTLLVMLIIVSMASQLLARMIPDNATGWLGYARRAASIIGLYTSSRLTKDVTLKAAVKHVAQNRIDELLLEKEFKPPFPGIEKKRRSKKNEETRSN